MACLLVLICLSIICAFLGPARTRVIVNSLPAGLYWLGLVICLCLTVVAFGSVRRSFAMFGMHLGCAIVLIGGMWGSRIGHELITRLTGSVKIPAGQMIILEGQDQDHVELPDGQTFVLPFKVQLSRFEIQYYRPGYILVGYPGRSSQRLMAVPGARYDLPDKRAVQVLGVFENLKVRPGPDGPKAYDDPNAGSNPAVQVRLTGPDLSVQDLFLFERYPQWQAGLTDLRWAYTRPIKDYISHVQVEREGCTIAKKAIEVNKPLHIDGYYLLQSSYGLDSQTGRMYTVLAVVSDSGLGLVFLGYGLIWIGMAWRLWYCQLRQAIRSSGREARTICL